MRPVALPGSGATASALGYGCSQLMTRTRLGASVRLLETALDAGVTHFDVARMYGYGEAERALGELLARHRDEVTVTTKLGLDPPRRTRGLALARSAARVAVSLAPPLRRLARRGATGLVRGGRFGVDDARASLETSLRELRTDRVDLLLLHDCRPDDLSDELLELLRDQVRAGRVGAFGIATGPDESRAIVAGRPEFAAVVQVENALVEPTVEAVPELWARPPITHSALLGLDRVHRHVARSAERRRRWSEAVGADCGDRRALGELMLAWALLANPDGVVLFSSRDPRNIAANAALELTPGVRERVDRLTALVRAELASQPGSIASTTGSTPSSSSMESTSERSSTARTDRTGA